MLPIDSSIWEAEIARLDLEVSQLEERQFTRIERGNLNDPSLWLDRTGWGRYLEDLNRPYILGLVGESDTSLLNLISKNFENLARKSQEIVPTIGYFGRFEIARTEKNQFRAKPFRVYQNLERISTYSLPWKRIFYFFVRTRGEPEPGSSYPQFTLSETQKKALEILIRLGETALENGNENSAKNDETSSNPFETSEEETEDDEFNNKDISTISIRAKAREPPSSLTRLERACLDFSISLLDQKALQDEYELPLIGALAVLELTEKGFKGVDSYPSLLSSVIKISRFLVLRYLFKENSFQNTLDSNSDLESTFSLGLGLRDLEVLDRIKTLVDRFLIRGSNSPISFALDLRAYGLFITQNTTKESIVDWRNDTILYGRISFSISDFRSFIHGLVSSTRTILFEELLFGNILGDSIPEIPWNRIYDNPLDSSPFFNFLRDSRTDLGIPDSEQYLFRKIARNSDLANRFRLPAERFRWNTRNLDKWFSILFIFLEKLLLLIYLTGGQPARAPELLSIRKSNSIETGTRGVFFENGLLSLVTFYYKGYSISGSTKVISRYLPREIGSLLVYYLWLIVPFQRRIGLGVLRREFSEYRFENPAKKPSKKSISKAKQYSSEQFRSIFRRETLAGLGVEVNPSEYRQISIAISRRYLRKNLQFQAEKEDENDEKDEDYSDEIYAQQAVHSSRREELTYAQGLFQPSGELASVKTRFREASIVSNYRFSLYI